jgi:hypothetical protein
MVAVSLLRNGYKNLLRRLHVRPDIDSDIKILIANLKDLMNLLNHCCSVMASQDKG